MRRGPGGSHEIPPKFESYWHAPWGTMGPYVNALAPPGVLLIHRVPSATVDFLRTQVGHYRRYQGKWEPHFPTTLVFPTIRLMRLPSLIRPCTYTTPYQADCQTKDMA
jgi:hypothetical protein